MFLLLLKSLHLERGLATTRWGFTTLVLEGEPSQPQWGKVEKGCHRQRMFGSGKPSSRMAKVIAYT